MNSYKLLFKANGAIESGSGVKQFPNGALRVPLQASYTS